MASEAEGLSPAVSPPFSDPSLAADLRVQDRDRWVSTLFAPSRHRDGLVALYAFNLEIARVRDIVSDPLPGEMRFQWWRDLLSGQARGDVSSHPVAAALLRAMARYNLPAAALSTLVEARTFDLYEDPMPSLNDLEGYCGETSSIIIRLATFILADGADPGGADLVGHAGVAFALTGLLRALPFHASRGQVFLPADMMQAHGVTREDVLSARDTPGLRSLLAELRARARHHLTETRLAIGSIGPGLAPALLPVCLVEPYLRQMEAKGYAPFRTPVSLPDWRAIWTIWRAARRARCA
jgi:phytoene synthase